MFELVFEGQIVDGLALATVKANMARLFKASDEKIVKMFGSSRVVLKNKLDKATALKYQAVLKKNGAICKIAAMRPMGAVTGSSEARSVKRAPSGEPAAVARPASAHGKASFTLPDDKPPVSSRLRPSPGTRTSQLPIAGEKVDEILAGVGVDLAPVGVLLGERKKEVRAPELKHLDAISLAPAGVDLERHKEVEAPLFAHIDRISVAPVGSDLVDAKELPPLPSLDVSHLSIAPAGSDMGQIKKEQTVVIPDISYIKLDEIR